MVYRIQYWLITEIIFTHFRHIFSAKGFKPFLILEHQRNILKLHWTNLQTAVSRKLFCRSSLYFSSNAVQNGGQRFTSLMHLPVLRFCKSTNIYASLKSLMLCIPSNYRNKMSSSTHIELEPFFQLEYTWPISVFKQFAFINFWIVSSLSIPLRFNENFPLSRTDCDIPNDTSESFNTYVNQLRLWLKWKENVSFSYAKKLLKELRISCIHDPCRYINLSTERINSRL